MTEALSVRALTVRLGAREVLRGLTLAAHFAEVTAILGPNGAGKSTLLKAVSGLVPHQAGDVLLSGRSARELDPRERAKLMSFVPQQSLLAAALPVHKVVAQGRYAHVPALTRLGGEDRTAVEEALAETDLLELRDRPFNELSLGEQRRVLLARALATGARTLLLDEPTAALDIEHSLRLFARLRTLAGQGRAVVVVLHQLDDALAYADRAVLLARGTLQAAGPAREVITAERVRALYGVELVPGGGFGFRLPAEGP